MDITYQRFAWLMSEVDSSYPLKASSWSGVKPFGRKQGDVKWCTFPKKHLSREFTDSKRVLEPVTGAG